jgi:YidC/Oxa1 family membrane protein insertase
LLKVLVYPTTRKSYLSSAKMRVLKPKLDEIQKKYPNKEDSMKMQQEIMQTYSMYGVSPMSGCLPILIQSPIWIAMFNFVPNAIELRGQKFLWSNDLSTYDDVIHFSTNIPFIGDHISLFCVLFCASNLLYSWLNMKMQKDSMVGQQAASQMKMMQWMMMLMPIFFFFIFNSYSAGLNYYYWISLLGSAITMWYLKWRTDDKKLLAKLEENYEKNRNNPQKVKGLAARLEALQKQQEMQQKKYGKH